MSWVKRVEAVMDALKGSAISEIELAEGEFEIILRRQPGTVVMVKVAHNDHPHHTATLLTDNSFHDVGTLALTDDPTVLTKGFNVPSLLGLGRTAPYLHDGSALTLRDRLISSRGTDQHGKLKSMNITDAQIDDLVEYLQGL